MQFPNIKKLQKDLKAPLLIKQKENLIYLTGQEFISGHLLITPPLTKGRQGGVVFFGDGLEYAQGLKNDTFKNLPKYLRAGTMLEIEDTFTAREQHSLKKVAPKLKCKFVSGVTDHLRTIKSKEELQFIRDAVKLTHEVFKEVKKVLSKDVWTEEQLARFIRYTGIGLGAQDVSFAPIVATGANSAIPHHKPSSRAIKPGEPIVLDFGFKVGHYCSDFTRTVFLKKVSPEFKKIYTNVERAYNIAFENVKAGMTGKEVDDLARKELHKEKLSKFFIHSLGHGTGLEIHEHPGVGPYSENAIMDGMVFSIEPGVYLKNKGGIRIEDLVYLENGKPKQFAAISTKLEDNII